MHTPPPRSVSGRSLRYGTNPGIPTMLVDCSHVSEMEQTSISWRVSSASSSWSFMRMDVALVYMHFNGNSVVGGSRECIVVFKLLSFRLFILQL